MSDLTDLLLTGLLNYGNTLLAVTLFLAALGIPLPATVLLMAAGAFVRQGVLPLESAVAASVGGAIAGDACSYLVGRHAFRLLPKRLEASGSWRRAAAAFARWGSRSVFVSRFLLTPMALPVNLLAGSTRYPWTRFMAAVTAGEVVWVALYGGLGHLFADQWEVIGQLVSDLAGLLIGAVLILMGAYALMALRKLDLGA